MGAFMMTIKLQQMVDRKIEEGKLLVIGSDLVGSHMTTAVVPMKITVDEHRILIEGEKLILDITNEKEKFIIYYDKIEEEFIIEQGDITIFLS